MSYLEEIIEEELRKLFQAVKSKFQNEMENGIKKVSSEIRSLVTQENEKEKDSGIFQFIQCEKCKRFHFENEYHVCNALRGNQNA
ncbi:hypothetical protein [Leptospira santarosai]|uniref:hypothetical protein n=1 Tax=Leptospira santarosai TaxID=28183 RepID=UPI0024AED684|nr:hypothetical protein [Leptospira santarosai]MDI7215742.1 hypothetical protein [Leptospira santarosai]